MAMREVGERYEVGEYFLPELIILTIIYRLNYILKSYSFKGGLF